MSFQNSSLPIAKFFTKWGKTARSYEPARAVIDAARYNNTITVTDLQSDVGKKRMFKISYYPMQCDVVGDNNDSVCSGSRTRQKPKQVEYKLKQVLKSKVFELAQQDIRLTDDGGMTFSDHAKAQIASQLPAMRKALSQQVLQMLIANTGLQPDGNTSRRLSFANTTNGVVTPIGKFELERVFQDTGFNNPFILGGAEVDVWKKATAIGTGNAGGQNIGQLTNDNMYYDALVNDAYGDGNEHILAFDPTVFKFIAWSRYQGMFATDLKGVESMDQLFKRSGGDKSEIRGTMIDPIYQLMWDIRIMWQPCEGNSEDEDGDEQEGVWAYQYFLNWDMFFMPDQTCNIQGVNGIFEFTTCPVVTAPCPTGDPLPSPVQAKTFTWDATAATAAPFYLAKLNIAGFQSSPNVNITSVADLAAALTANSNGIVFGYTGNNITYTGYTAIGGLINDTTTITFA